MRTRRSPQGVNGTTILPTDGLPFADFEENHASLRVSSTGRVQNSGPKTPLALLRCALERAMLLDKPNPGGALD